MYQVQTYNKIDPVGLEILEDSDFKVSSDFTDPDFIICRSQNLKNYDINSNLKAIGRAGAGVNNIKC